MATVRKAGGGLANHFFMRFGRGVGTVFLVLFLSGLIFVCIFAAYLKNYLVPQVSFSLSSFDLNQTSMIYYENKETRTWETLQSLYGSENRVWASYDEIPSNLVFATVAIEDKRFFEHHGVDWGRTMKASVNLFLGSSGATFGASTITQQLVKNLTSDNEVTVRRKLIEIFRALDIEKEYSKEEIMEWYLNTIYLGEQSYGVKTASYAYFGKDVKELDLAECASLIAITNNPSLYDPYISDKTKENNKKRQISILEQMLDQGYITVTDYNAAVGEELVFIYADSTGQEGDDSDYYSYFVDQVVRDVVSDLAEATGYDTELINTMVLNGGYQIYSTVDVDVQQAAEEVYENLDNIPKTTSTYQQLQSGIVIIDNATGDVSAIVGGVGQKEGSLTLSRATQSLLSPGSTIKPLTVYGPALNSGIITPATVYDDTPYSFDKSAAWPKNSYGNYNGLTNVLTAMKNSSNAVAVKALDDLTLDYSYEYAINEMQLTTLVDSTEVNGVTYTDRSYSALALGGMVRGVTVRAMTTAYAAIANKGEYREARTYTKVLDSNGNVILDNTQSGHTAMNLRAAWYLTYMMQETVASGTGTEAQLPNMPVAGKTGTTSDDKDRWFAGFTPYYTAVVWCGYDEPTEIELTDGGVDNPATYLWKQVMTKVSENEAYADFQKPADIISVDVCADSGLLPTEWCTSDLRGDRTITIQLAQDDVPSDSCGTHVQKYICNVSDQLANDYCVENGDIRSAGMLNVARKFPMAGVVVLDQQYAVGEPTLGRGEYEARCDTMTPANEYCTIHTENTIYSNPVQDYGTAAPEATPEPTAATEEPQATEAPTATPEPTPAPTPEPTQAPAATEPPPAPPAPTVAEPTPATSDPTAVAAVSARGMP